MPGLVLRPCARHFTRITSLQPHLNLKGGILIIIILLMRKTEVQGRGGAGPGSCCREAVEQDTVPKALIQSPCSWAVCPGHLRPVYQGLSLRQALGRCVSPSGHITPLLSWKGRSAIVPISHSEQGGD